MSKKDYLIFNEKVKKITTALDEAVPEGSKSIEVIFALCVFMANIYFQISSTMPSKEAYINLISKTLKNIMEEIENK